MGKTYLWKSLMAGSKSAHNNFKWKANKWYKIEGDLEFCANGFHASENIIDAMLYVDCEILAQVEVRGTNLIIPDKQCWQEMRIINKWTWGKGDSIRLAIYAANLVLPNFESKYPTDKRPREAIEAAKNYLRSSNKPTAAKAAEEAAWAADTAAYTAWTTGTIEAAEAAWTANSAASVARAAKMTKAAAASSWAVIAVKSAADYTGKRIKQKCHNWVLRRLKTK